MRDRTQINIWETGGMVFTTVHRIHPDGKESSEVLNIAEPMELKLVDEPAPQAVKGEHVYDWQR